MSGSWAEVMGWQGTLELAGMMGLFALAVFVAWAVGYADGRRSRRNRRRAL